MAHFYVLLSEGPDDRNVLYHLLTYHRLPLAGRQGREDGRIALEEGGGIDGVLKRLRLELKPQDEDVAIARLGVVVDADERIEERWQALRDIVLGAGYSQVPARPDPQGTIIEEPGRIGLGFWLMPDNQLAGSLERFAQLLLPADDRLWPKASAAVEQLPAEERLFREGDMLKAQLHTWLAWQREPGRPIGQAINNRYLDPNAPQAQLLVAWLRRVFPPFAA